ncbi:hypothetical protein Vau01_119520 [Virgisporangium aurantiacum]|uniref:Uncharacterized protein n=1 Tax=Virgisporangium aurantiacum TaxID=175570 RepID=A0A8J4E7D7_9ACTN|nr:hypothetical protein Vau01_119520 [Virgisporangium aurantiacum]
MARTHPGPAITATVFDVPKSTPSRDPPSHVTPHSLENPVGQGVPPALGARRSPAAPHAHRGVTGATRLPHRRSLHFRSDQFRCTHCCGTVGLEPGYVEDTGRVSFGFARWVPRFLKRNGYGVAKASGRPRWQIDVF